MKDFECIYLEPLTDDMNEDIDRLWCQDNVWNESDYNGNKATKYIRADLCKEKQGFVSVPVELIEESPKRR